MDSIIKAALNVSQSKIDAASVEVSRHMSAYIGENGKMSEKQKKQKCLEFSTKASIEIIRDIVANKHETEENTISLAPEEEKTGKSALEDFSPELRAKIEEMMKSIPPHTDVYPSAFVKYQTAVPTGRLVRCICKPGCTKELPQPEYISSYDDSFEGRFDDRPNMPKIGPNMSSMKPMVSKKEAKKIIKFIDRF